MSDTLKSLKSNRQFATLLRNVVRSIKLPNAKRGQFFESRPAFFTDVDSEKKKIKARRGDIELKGKVDSFLKDSIPAHFDQVDPILYLSRHIATPNFEALHFIEIAKEYDLPIVIGQDSGGKFVAMNPLKKCLGKLSVVVGMTRYQDEIIENFTVIDFNQCEGKNLGDIKTKRGKSLVELHNNLLREIYPSLVTIGEEEGWIDEHHRNNLIKQYEHILALNSYYGVVFEAFPPSETKFFNEIFAPAYLNVKKVLGVNPLVVELLSDTEDSDRDWNNYPSVIYPFLKNEI